MARPPSLIPEIPPDIYGLEALGWRAEDLISGNRLVDQINIESLCYRIGHTRGEGGLGKFGHFKNYVDLTINNPDLDCRKRFVWNSWSEKMLREACDWNELGVAGCTSAGKCCAPETLVRMFDGSVKRFDEVQAGDQVMGDDSTPRKVLEVHRGRGEMYKITPAQGDSWTCTGNHKLVLVYKISGSVVEIDAEKFYYMEKTTPEGLNLFWQIRKLPDGWEEFDEFDISPAGEGDWVGFSVDGNHRFLLGDYTVTHNSDPFALWAVMNYLMDPTHTLVLVMSTTLQGAKKRIWKTLKEYWNALPDLPGKPLWSTNEIRGLSYEGDDYGDSSGIFLLASEQSNEKTALDKLIGIKAPRTGQPDDSFESMWIDPEFSELKKVLPREHLEDLLPRLKNISKDRIGKLILIIDEATGCAESILNVIQTNLKPGNTGHFQVIMLGNPNSHWDTFGLFCTPVDGWQNVTLADEEWETTTGGLCIRFNGEKNPRIVDKNEKFSWMLRQEDISRMEETYGRDSLYFYRMCLGMWSPEGTDSGIYSQADLESNDAMKFAVWGFDKPTVLSALDPSFTNGGDRASCTFAHYGIDSTGKQVLELVEEIPIKVDINDTRVPVSYQMVRNWRRECEKRGCEAKNACFDSTGGGVTFADIVRTQWSALVQAISSAGKASKTPVGNERGADGKKMLCSERYANKATEIWYGMHPFLRSGQIRGLTTSLAKQICSRQHDKSGRGDGRVLQTESKRVFKAREGNSPDESDSWLLLVEHAKTRHGFKPSERAAVSEGEKSQGHGVSSWAAFVQKARRITNVKKLK